jgi:hypothetical protein
MSLPRNHLLRERRSAFVIAAVRARARTDQSHHALFLDRCRVQCAVFTYENWPPPGSLFELLVLHVSIWFLILIKSDPHRRSFYGTGAFMFASEQYCAKATEYGDLAKTLAHNEHWLADNYQSNVSSAEQDRSKRDDPSQTKRSTSCDASEPRLSCSGMPALLFDDCADGTASLDRPRDKKPATADSSSRFAAQF